MKKPYTQNYFYDPKLGLYGSYWKPSQVGIDPSKGLQLDSFRPVHLEANEAVCEMVDCPICFGLSEEERKHCRVCNGDGKIGIRSPEKYD